MKTKTWIIAWALLVMTGLTISGGVVYRVDPFFHYHKPDIKQFFYSIENERSQNDGITRHFSYDALITGTSMTENFKTSELDRIFGCNSIKVPYAGGTYKEINNSVARAIQYNPELKIVVRGLDMGKFFDSPELLREELGNYPDYLYDDNPLNDVKYILNRDILFGRALRMVEATSDIDFEPGITSFDEYARWHQNFSYGYNTVCKEVVKVTENDKVHLTDGERALIKQNIEQNVTDVAEKNPDVTFYYFYTPYSIMYWNQRYNDGTIYKWIEAEEYVTELILEHKNIKLYSFNDRYDITTDLNNYKDNRHYASWVNSLILKWMYDGDGLLTKDNYKAYLNDELDFYSSFDYESINDQDDYSSDDYAAALLNEELTGRKPEKLTDDGLVLDIAGSKSLSFLLNDGHNFLVFNADSEDDSTTSVVGIYNDKGKCLVEIELNHNSIDKRYAIDLTELAHNQKYWFKADADEDEANKLNFSDLWLY